MSRYAQFAKPIDLEKVTKELRDRTDKYNTDYELYRRVLGVLKTLDQWTYTKRISTAIEKAMPGYSARLERIASLINLRVWPSSYLNGEIRIFLGYESEPRFEFERFYEREHKSWDLLKESAIKQEKGLERVPELVSRYNMLLVDLKNLVDAATECGFEYDFDLLTRER